MAVPVSTHQVESAVLQVKEDALWTQIKALAFDKLAPNKVLATKWTEGGENQVGAVLSISYADGATWTVRISEISDVEHFVGYQVLHTEPAHQATSIQGRIELLAVTADDTTFVRWTTDFSNDADAAVIQDQKYKKLEFFADMKKTLAK